MIFNIGSINPGDYVIFSDFDGTITLMDTNVELVKKYGNERTKEKEALFASGDLPNREVILSHYESMRLTPEIYYETVFSLPIDPGFSRFYRMLCDKGLTLTVLSGSLGEGIGLYFAKHGFSDITVYGNVTSIDDGIIVFNTIDSIPGTFCGKGLCAHCKSRHIAKAQKEGKKTIYIGDGRTDTCVARHTDVLFAKSVLADWCDENGIAFVRFEDFVDLCEKIT